MRFFGGENRQDLWGHDNYPREQTLGILAEATGQGPDVLAERLLAVDKSRVDALLKELRKEMAPAHVRLLKTKLEALAEKSVSPRFNARKVAAR